MLQDSKLDAEELERRLIESQMGGAQEILNEMFATPGVSAKELLDALNRDAWKPLLSRLVINRAKRQIQVQAQPQAQAEAKKESVSAEPPRAYKGKKRGRKPKNKGAEPNVKASDIPEKNKAVIGGGDKRKIVMFTPEQKESQRKLIYKTVCANKKEITTPQLIRTVKSSYPQINDSVVRDMIKEMFQQNYLSLLRQKGGRTKAIRYTTGSNSL